MSGDKYFDTFLKVYETLRKKSDELNLVQIMNIDKDDINAFREECKNTELPRTCTIVTNMPYDEHVLGHQFIRPENADADDELYSGATEDDEPCGWGVLIRFDFGTCTVLKGVFCQRPRRGMYSSKLQLAFSGHWSHLAFGGGNVETLSDLMYDGFVYYSGGHGTINYIHNEDGYREYVGEVSSPLGSHCEDNCVGLISDGFGTLTLTDGTQYSGRFVQNAGDEDFEGEKDKMCLAFKGKCVMPDGRNENGWFLLVHPTIRKLLCGHLGEHWQRQAWEKDQLHNLLFDEWVERQLFLLNELKDQSTTPHKSPPFDYLYDTDSD